MMQLADMGMMGDLLGALVGALLLLSSLVQWFRYRHCAYNVDTGYWSMLALGFFFITSAYLGLWLLRDNPVGEYTALALLLIGYLAIAVALLRLFSWNAHRHPDTP